MIIYISSTIISVIFAYFSIYFSKININVTSLYNSKQKLRSIMKKMFAILSFLPLFIVSAIRYGVGTDYLLIYLPAFYYDFYTEGERFEVGFKLIVKLIRLFTSNYQWLFAITSLIFAFFIYKAIYEQSSSPCFSIILLVLTNFYFISMNAIRQCISIAIFMYSIKYIKSNNFFKYLIFILIAATMHKSVLVCIPIYFLYKRKVKLKTHIILLTITVISYNFISKAFIYIVGLTSYAGYFNSSYNTGKFEFLAFLINLSILIFCYFLYHRCKDDEDYNIMLNNQLIIIILCLFSSQIPLMSRIMWYFSFIVIIFLPKIINYIRNRYIRLYVKSSIIILYLIYMFYTIVIRGYQEVLPYKTFFGI